MSGKVTAAPSDQPGLYRFLIETGMAGKWELIPTAKVQGKAGPVTGKIVYDAKCADSGDFGRSFRAEVGHLFRLMPAGHSD